MPFDDDGRRRPPLRRARLAPSAPSEVFWALLLLTREREDLPEAPSLGEIRRRHPELPDRARALWGGDGGDHPEVFVLAERSGTLLDADLDAFLERFDETCRAGGADPGLPSESPEERARILERLRRLQDDAEARAALRAVLAETWAALRPEWEATGRVAVLETCADWSVRLDGGAEVTDLLPPGHIGRREPWLGLERSALARNALAVSPLFFVGGRGHLIEIGGLLHVGVAIDLGNALARRRALAEVVAGRLKVLSDPTRVAILSQLATEPVSVTELATLFGLSQPTVSAHVRLLREAGLLEARKVGGRTTYTATRERIERLLNETSAALLDVCVV